MTTPAGSRITNRGFGRHGPSPQKGGGLLHFCFSRSGTRAKFTAIA